MLESVVMDWLCVEEEQGDALMRMRSRGTKRGGSCDKSGQSAMCVLELHKVGDELKSAVN